MKKNFLVTFAVLLFIGLTANIAAAQNYNRIRNQKIVPVKGKKLILSGEVRDSDEIAYYFKAPANARLSVKVAGDDPYFEIKVISSFDTYSLVDDAQTWSGELPEDEKIEIVVHSNYKVTDYRLEITLR